MGSCVYIGYRAKKKADEIQQAYKANDLNKLAGALGVGNSSGASGSSTVSSSATAGGDSGGASSAPLSFPAWTPSPAGAESGTKVPLRPGLTVVTAIAQFGGDYESIKQIQQVSASAVRLSYRADNVPNPLEGLQKLSGDTAPKSSGSISGAAHGSHRRPANRPRLHAVVWAQPTGPHAGNDRDQCFPRSSGRTEGQRGDPVQFPHRRSEGNGGLAAGRSRPDGGRRRTGRIERSKRPGQHGKRRMHAQARRQWSGLFPCTAEQPARVASRRACPVHHRRRAG